MIVCQHGRPKRANLPSVRFQGWAQNFLKEGPCKRLLGTAVQRICVAGSPICDPQRACVLRRCRADLVEVFAGRGHILKEPSKHQLLVALQPVDRVIGGLELNSRKDFNCLKYVGSVQTRADRPCAGCAQKRTSGAPGRARNLVEEWRSVCRSLETSATCSLPRGLLQVLGQPLESETPSSSTPHWRVQKDVEAWRPLLKEAANVL